VDNQTTIIGTESVDVTAKSLNNTGAVIAQVNTDGTIGSNLNLTVETMTNTNLEDVDFPHSENKGINISINQGKKEQPLGKDNFNTIGIQYGDSGHDKAQTTYATIAAGNVTVGSEALGEDSTLNRDATKTQEITRDRELGGTNINMTVDTRYATDTKAKLAADLQNLEDLPGNFRTGLGMPHYLRNESRRKCVPWRGKYKIYIFRWP